jgi:hypothetical protein
MKLITDYNTCKSFMTKMLLNRRQAWWVEFLTRHGDQIMDCPSKSNGKADSLTRRLEDIPDGRDDTLKKYETGCIKAAEHTERIAVVCGRLICSGLSFLFFSYGRNVYLTCYQGRYWK